MIRGDVNVAEEQGVDPLLGVSKEPHARHGQLSETLAPIAAMVVVVVAAAAVVVVVVVRLL
jgi:hypothetical protein